MKKIILTSTAVILGCVGAQAAEQDKESNKSKDAGDTKLDFTQNSEKITWRSVNDSVMGGVSKGNSYETEASNRMFAGTISLKNNGGFASIRTQGGSYDLSDYTGMEITLRGDGRKYYFTSRANNRRMLAFWSPVQPKAGKWTTIKVPFDSFYATSFGRKIPNIVLNTKNITSFGFMMYDKKDGDFSLEIKSIQPYK